MSFFGSLTLADLFFPRAYDWRRVVISSLASPRDNPHGWLIATGGLAVSGLLLMPFAGFLRARLQPYAPGLSRWAGRFFALSALFLTLSALVVPGHYRILGLGRTHEHLAQIVSVAFCISLLLYLLAISRLPARYRWLRRVLSAVIIFPVGALILGRLSLFVGYEYLSPQLYRELKAAWWNNLALWEWIGALCIYTFLALMIFVLPAPAPDLKASPARGPRAYRF